MQPIPLIKSISTYLVLVIVFLFPILALLINLDAFPSFLYEVKNFYSYNPNIYLIIDGTLIIVSLLILFINSDSFLIFRIIRSSIRVSKKVYVLLIISYIILLGFNFIIQNKAYNEDDIKEDRINRDKYIKPQLFEFKMIKTSYFNSSSYSNDILRNIIDSDIPLHISLVENYSTHLSKSYDNELYIFPDTEIIKKIKFRHLVDSRDPYFDKIIEFLKKAFINQSFFTYLSNNVKSIYDINHTCPVTINEIKIKKWNELNDHLLSYEDSLVFMYWLRNYVGQWCPRLKFTLINNSNEQLFLSSIVFRGKYSPIKISKGGNDIMNWDFIIQATPENQTWKINSILNQKSLILNKNEIQDFNITFLPDNMMSEIGEWSGDFTIESDSFISRNYKIRFRTFQPTHSLIND